MIALCQIVIYCPNSYFITVRLTVQEVYSYSSARTFTDIKLLGNEDRVLEIARMLSGEELTEAAISNARELLN